ncbi:MAG: hypothetical protein M3R38_33715 [Actinomycetota bacterium]|nr:hypothetical protein [Actinomycetota bacterium]
MKHKPVRFLTPHFPKDKIDEEVEREDKMVRWADSLYLNTMRMTAAASLVECGTLEKAASLLEAAGFRVPAGFFPEEEEDEFFDLGDEGALRRYVEMDEEGIRTARASIGFYLAGAGQSMDPVEDHIKRG